MFLSVAGFTAAHAQDVVHYKFDDLCGTRVINYASGSPAPAEGTITSTLGSGSSVPGRFGLALAAGDLAPTPSLVNYVVTGWNPGMVTGSLSWAAWIRVPPSAPTPSLTYLFGSPSNFRCFVNNAGSTAGRVQLAGWGGSNLLTASDVRTLARTGWVHLACVVDGSAGTATWYVNGMPETPLALSSSMSWSGTTFHLGKHNSDAYPSLFEIDEFLLTLRALTPVEVAALANTPRAADAAYGAGGCGGLTLASSGGTPGIGNATYALTLASGYSTIFSIGAGSSRCTLGALPLPLDLGTYLPGASGCLLEADQDLASAGGSKTSGTLSVPFPVPPDPSLAGVTLYIQAAGIDVTGPRFVLSNAFAISLGH